jgi:nitrogen fixation NifU-like protein
MYSPQVIDHFENPRNMGVLPGANGVGIVGAPGCGDVLKLQLRIVTDPDGTERIADVKAKVYGCGSAIASTSYLTEAIKGKALAEAEQVTNQGIAAALSLPPVKVHCSVLAEEVLHAAIADYRKQARVRADAGAKTQA